MLKVLGKMSVVVSIDVSMLKWNLIIPDACTTCVYTYFLSLA